MVSGRGGPGRGQGRTPDRGAPRTERIEIRATEADKAELTVAAAAVSESLGDFLINAGLRRARSIR